MKKQQVIIFLVLLMITSMLMLGCTSNDEQVNNRLITDDDNNADDTNNADDANDDDTNDDDVCDDDNDDDDTVMTDDDDVNPPPPNDQPNGLPIDFSLNGNQLTILFNDFNQEGISSGIGVFQEVDDNWDLVSYLPESQISGGLVFPHTLDVTENGWLISDSDQARAIEINQNGEIVWEHETGSFTNEALETTDNNRLLTVGNQLWLIDTNGAVIWKLTVVQNGFLHHGQILDNGNILTTSTEMGSESGEVIEMTTEGEMVWQFTSPELFWPRNAWRLENGDTIVAHKYGIWQIAPNGQIVWETLTDAAVYNIQLLDNGWIVAVVGPDIIWFDEFGQMQKKFFWQGEPPQTPLSQKTQRLLKSHPYLN